MPNFAPDEILPRLAAAMMTCFLKLFAFALAGALPLAAQVPRLLDYQGRIAVQGVNFDGQGQFKFALVDGSGTATYWSHDGTSTAGGAPASFITVPVAKGLYAVRLGDPAVTNMAALSPGVFDHPDVRLRVWFNDGVTGFQQLAPDRRLAAVAYALMAEEVPDASITADKLAPGAVTSAKLAPGSVTADKLAPGIGLGEGSVPPGVMLFSADPADPALLGQDYKPIHTFPGGVWENPGAAGAPSGRRRHSAVWNGASVIIWGGTVSNVFSSQGGRYTPATNAWAPLPVSAASPARADHTAVWDGARMIVWGGLTGDAQAAPAYSDTGALYDPAAQLWVAMPAANAPEPRSGHSAVWAGAQMLVWGGGNLSGTFASGGIYTPPVGPLAGGDSGAWGVLPAGGSPPSARRDHAAAWAGGRMIVWGGESSGGTALADGASYNPATGIWTALPASPLSARLGHAAVAAGDRIVFFGGAAQRFGAVLHDGAIYDPAANAWTLLPAAGAPEGRQFHQMVWTGSEVLILGGELGTGQPVLSAGAFHATRHTWRALPSLPEASSRQTATWTGTRAAVFGANGLRLIDPKPPATLYGKF